MVRPHYITRRVGEDYVLVRVDPLGHIARWISGGIGMSLLSRGIRRGGIGALLAFTAGAACLYHAATGRNPMNVLGSKDQARHGDAKDSPSFPGEAESKQVPADVIEESSMESFPASDPPAHRTAASQT
jgi:hypothetical protein